MSKFRLSIAIAIPLTVLFTFACNDSAPETATSQRPSPAARSGNPAGCDLDFEGSDRKAVKLRDPRQAGYRAINGGRPISVSEWFTYVCAFDEDAPSRRNQVPQDRAMDTEKHRVTLRAYVLAVRREDDHDFHIQVGDRRQWDQEQVVVEVPPGPTYCDARNAIADLMRADGANATAKTYVFRNPPQASITGFVFLDSAHIPGNALRSDYCRMNGNRGIKGGLSTSPVRGLWEIHPVIKVEAGASSAPPPAAPDTRRPSSPTTRNPATLPADQIVGNRNSKVYHSPGCPDYAKVSEKNRVYFASEAAAQQAGYRKARNCP